MKITPPSLYRDRQVRRIGLLALAVAASLPAAEPSFVAIEKVGSSVGFYTETGERVAGIKVGPFPHEATLSRDGRLLYVSNNGVLWMTEDTMGTNTISVIDVRARKKLYDIDLGKFHRPHGIALVPGSDDLVVTTERPFGLIRVDPAARKVVRDFDVKGKSPHMVMPASRGDIAFVSNTDSDSVAVVNLKTGDVKVIPTGGKPQGGVFSKDGSRLFLTNGGANQIAVIDATTHQTVGAIPTGEQPGRIAITPDGKTLVYNMQAGAAVGFADIATLKQTALIPVPGKPLSLTMTADGKRAFAGLQEADKIAVISVADRKIERVIDTPKGSGPDPVIPLGR
jgi:YVTN family beta-propeller protein